MDERDTPIPVSGAVNNLMNLTDMIYHYGDQLDRIVVCLDQHPFNHICHPEMWVDRRNRNPKPFTHIEPSDITSGRWRASVPSNQEIQADYIHTAPGGMIVKPPHCIAGSRGATLCPRLASDLKNWSSPTRLVHFYTKSQNWSTEHISSFQTEVIRYDDGTTWFNNYLYNAIQSDTILIAGIPLSHGLKATVMDAIDYSGDLNLAERMVILEDCVSSMPGCTVQGQEFLNEFIKRGGRVDNSVTRYSDLLDC